MDQERIPMKGEDCRSSRREQRIKILFAQAMKMSVYRLQGDEIDRRELAIRDLTAHLTHRRKASSVRTSPVETIPEY
jgi:hypothetical protein